MSEKSEDFMKISNIYYIYIMKNIFYGQTQQTMQPENSTKINLFIVFENFILLSLTGAITNFVHKGVTRLHKLNILWRFILSQHFYTEYSTALAISS